MEAFEVSPDAERHGGISILQELVANQWRRLLRPQTRLFPCAQRNTYAIAVGAGSVDPKFSAFPFAGSLSQMANSLGRSKDLPEPIQSLIVGLAPYPGGDDALSALNESCVSDKHNMLIPVGTVMVQTAADVRATGYFTMPEPHMW